MFDDETNRLHFNLDPAVTSYTAYPPNFGVSTLLFSTIYRVIDSMRNHILRCFGHVHLWPHGADHLEGT